MTISNLQYMPFFIHKLTIDMYILHIWRDAWKLGQNTSHDIEWKHWKGFEAQYNWTDSNIWGRQSVYVAALPLQQPAVFSSSVSFHTAIPNKSTISTFSETKHEYEKKHSFSSSLPFSQSQSQSYSLFLFFTYSLLCSPLFCSAVWHSPLSALSTNWCINAVLWVTQWDIGRESMFERLKKRERQTLYEYGWGRGRAGKGLSGRKAKSEREWEAKVDLFSCTSG